MKTESNKYKIDYHKINNGEYKYTFNIDSELFSIVEDSEIKGGECVATISLTKSHSRLKLDVVIDGEVIVDCDRCLEELSLPIHYEGVLIVEITNTVKDVEFKIDDHYEDTMYINPLVEALELKEYLHDSIILSLPIQRVHDEDGGGCNPDMLARFAIATNDWDLDYDEEDEEDEEEDDEDYDLEFDEKEDKK